MIKLNETPSIKKNVYVSPVIKHVTGVHHHAKQNRGLLYN